MALDDVARPRRDDTSFWSPWTRLPWMPISVSPNSTWLSFLSLLPPMAIFLAAIQLSYRERRTLILVVIAVGVISVFVGLIQVAEGPNSPWRFFAFTNVNEAVGFFAGRDDFAAFLYVVLVFASVWTIDVGFKVGSWTDLRNSEHFTIVAATAVFMVVTVLLAAEAVARSRAGLALTIVALLAIFALSFTDRRRTAGATPSKLLLGATILAFILSIQFALYRVIERFADDPLQDARIVFAHNTIQAAKAFMPFGAGLGSFVPVYAMFEKPIDTLANVYANHAHNDILELWLETGIVGVPYFGLFVGVVGTQNREDLAKPGRRRKRVRLHAWPGRDCGRSGFCWRIRSWIIQCGPARSWRSLPFPARCWLSPSGLRNRNAGCAGTRPGCRAAKASAGLCKADIFGADRCFQSPLGETGGSDASDRGSAAKSSSGRRTLGRGYPVARRVAKSQEEKKPAPGTAESAPNGAVEPGDSGTSEFDQGNSSGPETKT